MSRKRYNWPAFAILFILSIVMIYPFIWMFFSAFKTTADVYSYPIRLLPSKFTFENFIRVFKMIDFGRYFLNTIVTTVAQTALQMVLSITAAYAFAKLDFPFKRTAYMVVQSAMFVPFSVLIIPLYQLVVKAGLVDTYGGIILPQMLGVFTTMLLVSFFSTIPQDLTDAAKMDGCNHFLILRHVILANSTTSISAAVLYAFLNHWKSYLWPLLVTNDNRLRTLAVGLKYLISEANSAYQYMIAAALMSILPLMFVYVLCEKNFVRSITMTGLKS